MPISTSRSIERCPHITIIRPVKGIEPYLYECLAATFLQSYPKENLTISLCISSRTDPALPLLKRLLADFPSFDAKVFIEEEDPNLSGQDGHASNLGPNPKIRNMSCAYREAKGDVVWIIDCNVWVGPHAAGRMVDILCGFSPTSHFGRRERQRKYKFVHQLPLVIDVKNPPLPSYAEVATGKPTTMLQEAGGLLEEMFLSTSHAKLYTAINTVAIAPCTLGKSNMFRRSHLNTLTSPSTSARSTASVPLAQQQQPGIDYFSSNICEDHLIGDLLWKNPVPSSVLALAAQEGHAPGSSAPQVPTNGEEWGNHALLPPHPTNIAVQPTASLALSSYISRRVRWLRVRKFTVTLATLVEPGTESIICSLYGAYALTTLSWFHERGIPQSWTIFWSFWLLSLSAWMAVDWWVYGMLQCTSSVPGEAAPFALKGRKKRSIRPWVLAWLGREFLAFPIWAWASFGGVSVQWRGRSFRVGIDMRVREVEEAKSENTNLSINGKGKNI